MGESEPIKAYSYIRFSSERQLQGDSVRRQIQMSEAYAARAGLVLDESLTMKDLGVSAFRGKNLKDGALGSFMQAVEEGRVPKGSYLLVESLDRLSRMEPSKAIRPFLDIIDMGIVVVTVGDGHEYREGLDTFKLMYSLMVMSRAHEESDTKSKRTRAALEKKRNEASIKKVSPRGPSWLKYDKSTDSFLPIPEKVQVIQRIFRMCLDGYGTGKTATILNEEKIPTLSYAKEWKQPTITHILQSRNVLGEFQAFDRIDGKRVPVGDAVLNYYPAIVNENDYLKAQQCFADRKQRCAGRRGDAYSNLFVGLLECPYCKERMITYHARHNRNPNSVYRYIRCRGAKFHKSCDAKPIRYDDFEMTFLKAVSEIQIAKVLMEGNVEKTTAEEIEDQLTVAKAGIQEKTDQIEKHLNLIASLESPPMSIVKRIEQYEADIEELRSQIQKLRNTKVEGATPEKRALEQERNILDLIEQVRIGAVLDKKKHYELRSKLASSMREIVDAIMVFAHRSKHPLPFQKNQKHGQLNRNLAYFVVRFKNNQARWVQLEMDGNEVKTIVLESWQLPEGY